MSQEEQKTSEEKVLLLPPLPINHPNKSQRKKKNVLMILITNKLFVANCMASVIIGILIWWHILQSNNSIPYILAGIIGIIIQITTMIMMHFTRKLSKQNSFFSYYQLSLNKKAKKEFEADIRRFENTKEGLKDIKYDLHKVHAKYIDNFSKFCEISLIHQVESEDLHHFQNISKQFCLRWYGEIFEIERDMLRRRCMSISIDDYYFNRDGSYEMTVEEFKQFGQYFPSLYKEKFEGLKILDYESLNDKATFQYDDLMDIFNVLIEMVVEDIHIQCAIVWNNSLSRVKIKVLSKGIRCRSTIIVNGYIRDSEYKLFGNIKNPYYTIHPLINQLCLWYYYTSFKNIIESN